MTQCPNRGATLTLPDARNTKQGNIEPSHFSCRNEEQVKNNLTNVKVAWGKHDCFCHQIEFIRCVGTGVFSSNRCSKWIDHSTSGRNHLPAKVRIARIASSENNRYYKRYRKFKSQEIDVGVWSIQRLSIYMWTPTIQTLLQCFGYSPAKVIAPPEYLPFPLRRELLFTKRLPRWIYSRVMERFHCLGAWTWTVRVRV